MLPDMVDRFVPFAMVFGGCCLAMVFFELALKQSPGCGNFLTFTEMVFIFFESISARAMSSSPDKKQHGLFRPLIAATRDHVSHAVLWVSMSWLVNFVYQFKIEVPTHTTIRACNILTTVVLGYLVFGEKYSFAQCLAGVLVTIGIVLASLADAVLVGKCGESTSVYGCLFEQKRDQTVEQDIGRWSIGILLLLLCLAVQAMLGHTQKRTYDKYLVDPSKFGGIKKNDLADEFLFTSVVASLLGSLGFYDEILQYGKEAINSPRIGGIVPIQFLWILGNNISQATCIKGVFRLYTRNSTLAVNITLSVRKFLTVVISIITFGNPWSTQHSLGAVFVFGGAFLYSNGGMCERRKEKST